MNCAIYFPLSPKNGYPIIRDFIVETLFLITGQHPELRFIVITNKKSPEQFSLYPIPEIVIVKPLPRNILLKKIWRDVKLPGILKKKEADIFISLDHFCSLTASIPQCIVVHNAEKTRASYVKKARLLFVPNKMIKEDLIKKYEIQQEKIVVIYPSSIKMYEVIDAEEKEVIKNKYSDGKEFFLFNSIFPGREDFVTLLKSFSHFKKRQQSNFKLLLAVPSNSYFEKSLNSYRYRSDVKFIDTKDKKAYALITASAYAVVLPFNANEDMIAALNAARSGAPVIAIRNSVTNEIAGDAALYAETGAIKDIGEKMMQLYTDEGLRSKFIENGKQVVANYSDEKSTELLWQSILKVLQ